MKTQFCCQIMANQVENWKCDIHGNRFDCPDALIDYNEVFAEY